MRCSTIVCLAAVGAMFGEALQAAKPNAAASKAAAELRGILAGESSGQVESRQSALRRIVDSHPEYEQARWQSGQVRHGDGWEDFKSLPASAFDSATLVEYRTRRQQTPAVYRSQLDLADWCRRNKLPVRERAHLAAALELSPNPDDIVLRGRLGFERVGGTWMHRRDIAAVRDRQLEQRANLKLWAPRIRKLVKRAGSKLKRVRTKAIADLKAIKDPAAIPALELTLGTGDLESLRLLVEVLGGIRSHHASDALARLAVLSDFEVVRNDASRILRRHPIEAFAPELLASLRTKIDSKLGLFVGQGGVHLMHFAASETQETRQIFTGGSSTFISSFQRYRLGTTEGNERDRNRVNRAAGSASIEAQFKARAAEKNVAARNRAIGKWNARVCAVLADATGARIAADPQEWWDWWKEYNQIESEGREKRREYRRYYERKTTYVENNEPEVITERGTGRLKVREASPVECLVAGTPVWTDRGFVVVEKIQIGDLVLAKHPETGELAYQPVTRTTIRKEEPVMTATTAGGTIRATGGHTFWVVGRGWTKLRDAKPGDRFHTITGTATIKQLEASGRAKTYNLVVDGMHTYFVGKDLVMSHDVTFAEPTDVVVPGLIPFADANDRHRPGSAQRRTHSGRRR